MNESKMMDEILEKEFHFSPEVTIKELTIEFFEQQAAVAKEKGFTNWATQTNKDTDPWLTRVVFFTGGWE